MLRTAVEERLRDERARDGRVFPAYDGYCFGSVPDTIRSILGADARRTLPDDVFGGVRTDVTNVVTVVVDGYGLDSWKRDRHEHAFLERLTDRGTVTPLTSIYPSETAAAMTTFETGQLPCEHGRIGWNVYEPESDRSFLALTGEVKHGSDEEFAAESTDGVDYHYEDLAAAGVDCHRVQPLRRETDGVTHHHYEELASFGERLARVVETSDDPAYVYGYVPDVDHVSHAEGTGSAAFRETVVSVCTQLEAFVGRLDPETAAETLLFVTADHGHVNTDPNRNVDLSGRETVVENLRTHADGAPVKLAGSPRNAHLHLRDGSVGAVRDSLSDLDANLFTRAMALDRELFGDRAVSDRFRRRCGDLVVTHRDLGVWWGDVEPDELGLVGMHGGLDPGEMLVPFAAVRADQL